MNRMIKWSKLFLVCVIALGMGSGVFIHQTDKAHAAVGVSYYVDSDGGNDQNSGHSPSEAWKSLANVNATIFQPGDKILFKAGGIWNGRMYPRGSGNSANPITIDMYGVGSKPLIAGNGAVREVIFLFNQQYWEINNLEITNKGTVAVDHRKGVFITAHDGGTLEHIYLRNLVVHDVNANNNRYEQGGIIFTVTGNSVPTKYNDILVEGNTVYSVDRVGIFMSSSWANRHYVDWGEREWIGHTNVVIQNNTVYDFGGDAILPLVTSGAIVQNNVAYDGNYRANTMSTGNRYAATMWTGNSDNITFQYNEAYNSNGILDGMGFDADYDSKGTTIQYNYSHDNAGGFVMIMGAHNRMDPRNNDDVTIRYNISQNDATVGNWVIQFSQGIPNNTQIYNNTFYSGPSISNWMIGGYSGDLFQDNTYYLTNNIFYNLGSGGYYAPRSVFDSNVFYGNHPTSEPEDANKITTDPMFVFPGSGGIGRDTVDGYKLLEGSPAIGSGAVVANNGGEDYWGNPVSATERPNRGAYNGSGVVGSPQAPPIEVSSRNILINPGFETGDIAPWGKTGPVEVQGKVVNTNAHNGTYAMELGVGYNGFDKTVTGLTPNTNYQVTAVIKNRFKGDVTFLGVQGYGGSQNTSVTGTVYEMAMLQFRTGPTDTEANIYLWKGEGNKDVTYVDDLSLVLAWNAEQAPIAGKSSESAITDFKVPGQVGASILDETANTVTIHVPFGTDVSRLTADVFVSDKARVSPMRGAIVDLNTPQTFSVTAENGLIQPWVITAIINAKSSDKLITGFKVPGQVGVSTIDTNAHTVTIHMPFGSDVSNLTPDVSVSVKAQVSPNQGAVVNFETPQTYTVTAEDGSVQEWTITVIINAEDYVKSSEKLIKDFKVSGQVGVSTIDTNAHTVTLHMPFGSDVSKLTPDVSISDKAQASPNQGAVVNFSTPQSYTVTAEDGTIQMWSITVIVDAKDNGSGGNGSGGNSGGVTGSGTNSNSNGSGSQDKGTQIVSESFLRNASGTDVVIEAGDGINEILLPVNAAELLNNRALEIRIGSTVVQLSPEVLNSLFKLIGSEAAQGLQISVHVAKLSEQNLSSLLQGTGEVAFLKSAGEAWTLELSIVQDGIEKKKYSFDPTVNVKFAFDGTRSDKDLLGVYYFNKMSGKFEYIQGKREGASSSISIPISSSGIYSVLEYNKAFQDVPLSHWVNQALKIMTALHVVEGRSDNRFEPNGQATRAEFIAVLARLLDLPSDGNNYFEDVSSSNWYQNAVNAAYQAGMIRGRTETKFVPNGVITREEVAVILEHAYAYITGKTAVASSVTFGDTSSISEWAKSSVGVVSEQGLMKGINGNKFAPKQFITRAEMVQAMYNLFLKLK